MSSPNFHTNSLYFNHNSPNKLLYYAWVTCDYISRKISPRNWFQCFPVYPRYCSGSGSSSVSVSGSVSGFRISWFSIRPFPSVVVTSIMKINQHYIKFRVVKKTTKHHYENVHFICSIDAFMALILTTFYRLYLH